MDHDHLARSRRHRTFVLIASVIAAVAAFVLTSAGDDADSPSASPPPRITSATIGGAALTPRVEVGIEVPEADGGRYPTVLLSLEKEGGGSPMTKTFDFLDSENQLTLPYEVDPAAANEVLASVVYADGGRSKVVAFPVEPDPTAAIDREALRPEVVSATAEGTHMDIHVRIPGAHSAFWPQLRITGLKLLEPNAEGEYHLPGTTGTSKGSGIKVGLGTYCTCGRQRTAPDTHVRLPAKPGTRYEIEVSTRFRGGPTLEARPRHFPVSD